MRDLQLTPQATENSLHREGFVPGYAGGTNYRSKALLHVSVGYISSSEAEFSSHKMKWAIRLTGSCVL